jgi:hypothetical protein
VPGGLWNVPAAATCRGAAAAAAAATATASTATDAATDAAADAAAATSPSLRRYMPCVEGWYERPRQQRDLRRAVARSSLPGRPLM